MRRIPRDASRGTRCDRRTRGFCARPELNGPGGCNEGFLRDDALLMVTFAANTPDIDSAGKPKLWADAVLAAKHGDPRVTPVPQAVPQPYTPSS